MPDPKSIQNSLYTKNLHYYAACPMFVISLIVDTPIQYASGS